jgi:REP element-mobilizing transposase RayT
MARRPRFFAPGVLYHVIVRGNHKQKTFFSPQDYEVYSERLTRYRNKFHVSLHAYCLMPNHVHLLLECAEEPLSKFMQGIQQSYTQSGPFVPGEIQGHYLRQRPVSFGAGPLHSSQSGTVESG